MEKGKKRASEELDKELKDVEETLYYNWPTRKNRNAFPEIYDKFDDLKKKLWNSELKEKLHEIEAKIKLYNNKLIIKFYNVKSKTGLRKIDLEIKSRVSELEEELNDIWRVYDKEKPNKPATSFNTRDNEKTSKLQEQNHKNVMSIDNLLNTEQNSKNLKKRKREPDRVGDEREISKRQKNLMSINNLLNDTNDMSSRYLPNTDKNPELKANPSTSNCRTNKRM